MKEILPDKTEHVSVRLKESRENYVAVAIDKSDAKNLISGLHLGITWALRKAGVENVDLTLREKEDHYEIIVET